MFGFLFELWDSRKTMPTEPWCFQCVVCFWAEPLIMLSIWHKEERQGTFSLHKYLSHYCGRKITEERIRRYQLIFIVNWPKSILLKTEQQKHCSSPYSLAVPSSPPSCVLVSDTNLVNFFFFSILGLLYNSLVILFLCLTFLSTQSPPPQFPKWNMLCHLDVYN